MTDGLKHKQRETIIKTLSANPKVERIALFGSRAMGTFTPTSDIDIALFGDDLTLSDQAALAEEMAELPIPQRVDILIYHRIENQALRAHIRKHGVEWFARTCPYENKRSLSMAGEWTRRKLGSLGRVVTGKTPPTADPANFGGPYPFITIPDLDGRRVIDSAERTLSEKGAETVRSCLLPSGTVMMSCIATVGKCGVTAKPSFTNQQINSVIPNDKTDPGFLYYLFTQLGHELESAGGGGSVYTNVSKSRFSEIEVSLPEDVSEQRAIAHILGTLDDKIELNRKQNGTLEAMARALFRAWFVDFEPVRAKMEGRWQRGQSLPGLPAHLYDLFPDRLVESELGEIPEGWRHSTIGEEVTVCGGFTPSTKEPKFWVGGQHCWATPKDLSALKFPVLLDTDRKITDAGIAKISSGLLPVGTVLLSSRAPIGYLAIAEVPTAINQGFIAMKCDGALPNVFVLLWCRESMDAIIGNANGSTFQEISKSNFRPLRVVIPSAPVLEIFTKSAGSLYRQMVENERESRTLAQMRDTLLPKLISGEIRVRDAERFLERVGA